MLLKLQTKNYAFFEDIDITFSDGLNVITGESGSGKSLFVKALMTLIGDPQDTIKINENSMIQGYLIVDRSAREILKERGINAGEELIITASFQNKRLIYRINGIMVPRDLLKRLSKELFVFHTQGSQSKLFSNSFYMNLVDQFVDEKLLQDYRKIFRAYSALSEKKQKYGNNISDILRKRDFLRFQINEIESFVPDTKEEEELNKRYSMMLNSKRIRDSLIEALENIRMGDGSVYEILNNVKYAISDLNEASLKDLVDKLDVLIDLIEDWRYEAEKIYENAEYNPEEFKKIEERLNGYQLLKRKYGPDVETITKNLKSMKKELLELENIEAELNKIDDEIETLKISLNNLALKIREERKKAALKLEKRIKKHLDDLNMKNTKIRFYFNELNELSVNGLDELNLIASINPGTPEDLISKIASGGELSRIMLAIELAISEGLGDLSLIFDEVDAGIGQRIVEVLAKKLKNISQKHQVLVVSHLPQIPLIADKHFVVQKTSMKNETKIFIKELSENERVDEIVNMFGSDFKDMKIKIEEVMKSGWEVD
ncbi:MAG TPA: hypothetical protein ENF81_07040 [Thermotogaceae bacterium]|nr:hypothetical protein [Thermotogaceae bacterium]